MSYLTTTRKASPACRKKPKQPIFKLDSELLLRATVILFLISVIPHGLNLVNQENSMSSQLTLVQYETQLSSFEEAIDIIQTLDGGYALIGCACTGPSLRTDTSDLWLIKMDISGLVEWNKTYGGLDDDLGCGIVQTTDGGYILGGSTISNIETMDMDLWLLKTNDQGIVQWNLTYNISVVDLTSAIVQTEDDGFVLAGCAGSYDSYRDSWFWEAFLVKIDANGNVMWKKIYSRAKSFTKILLVQTYDGGFAITTPTSNGNNITLIKTDTNGIVEWLQTYNAYTWDIASSVLQTEDGGFILLIWSTDGILRLLKTDAKGSFQWNQIFELPKWDLESALIQVHDGSIAFAVNNMLKRTDTAGNLQWGQTFSDGTFKALIQTADGSFTLAGSFKGDIWVAKTNKNGFVQWEQFYSGVLIKTNASKIITTSNKELEKKRTSVIVFFPLLLAIVTLAWFTKGRKE